MKECLRSICPVTNKNNCCLECMIKDTCNRPGKCSWDNDLLDLNECSK